MANTIYANTDTGMVGTGGGHLNLAVGAGATEQVNAGTVLPCRVAYINGISQGMVKWSINTSTAVSTAAFLPVGSDAPAAGIAGYLELPIDDLSKVWIFASLAASVNITYRY